MVFGPAQPAESRNCYEQGASRPQAAEHVAERSIDITHELQCLSDDGGVVTGGPKGCRIAQVTNNGRPLVGGVDVNHVHTRCPEPRGVRVLLHLEHPPSHEVGTLMKEVLDIPPIHWQSALEPPIRQRLRPRQAAEEQSQASTLATRQATQNMTREFRDLMSHSSQSAGGRPVTVKQ